MKKTIFHALLLAFISHYTFAAPRPNIILVMADDMGWGDPGYNSMTVTYADGTPHPDQGWISTPTMDAMAANGLRFDRFYSASAVCSPTRASCLTGRNPIRVGVPNANSGRLGFDETPLSEVLSNVGYTCGHFGKWHLGSMTTLRSDSNRGGNASVYSAPWHHSYDFCYATESKVPTYHPYRKANNSASLPTSFSDSNFYGTRYWRMPATWNQTSGEGDAVPVTEVNNSLDGDDSKLIVDQAIPFIQGAVAQGKPFFVVVWFHTPHKPTVDPDGTSGVDSPDTVKDSIEDLDTALGRLRNELTTLGVRGNTMLWVTSDNGPENGQNSTNETNTVRSIRSGRLLERKRSLHEGGVRVPGLLEWPDVITSGMTTNVPAITSDYYPTILDYLQISVPNQKPLDGISLRPVIDGTATVRTKPIGFKYAGDNSWVNQQYKLINDGSGWELYDLINIATGQEPEQTALATASNINSQPQAIQDIYNTMLAEYTAWNTSTANDTPYVHSTQPTANLSTPLNTVSSPFTVTVTFNETVSQLHANEFVVTNGTASGLAGAGTTWMVTITPATNGAVTIDLPEGCAIDAHGNPNASSNQLNITYSNPSAPDVNLSTPTDPVDTSFAVTTTFTEDVTGLEANDFVITNGSASNLSGGPVTYTMTVTPISAGSVIIFLPAGSTQDAEMNGNNASNSLSITYNLPVLPTNDITLTMPEGQTVDSSGNAPGNQSNNLAKFTAGSQNDGVANPYTSNIFVRGSSSDPLRRINSHIRFDVSSVSGLPITNATLSFNGHSLNNQNAVDIQVAALAADWEETGSPAPTFNHATVGNVIGGGSIITDLDPADHTKNYTFDVTTMVQNWADGVWSNHGILLQLSNILADNGLGIKTSGINAIQLVIQTLPFAVNSISPSVDGNVTLEWNSIAGATYRIETNENLQGDWTEVDTITGSAGISTSYTHVGGIAGATRRFYRIVFVSH